MSFLNDVSLNPPLHASIAHYVTQFEHDKNLDCRPLIIKSGMAAN